jgi:hypothetical protein
MTDLSNCTCPACRESAAYFEGLRRAKQRVLLEAGAIVFWLLGLSIAVAHFHI